MEILQHSSVLLRNSHANVVNVEVAVEGVASGRLFQAESLDTAPLAEAVRVLKRLHECRVEILLLLCL